MDKREIKFRAWNSNVKEMRTPYAWQNETNMFSTAMCWSPTENLMQFTGLKDCNGADIYEGDIIQDDEFYVSQIYWCDETHMWACTDIGGLCDVPSEVKVIGNIYQNPMLLEDV